MSRACLLDANALIALTLAEHEHHDRAARWASSREIALCPVVEGALVRFLIRTGASSASAAATLMSLHDSERCAFWSDSISYANVNLGHVAGHRQVTDAYLASLAQSRGTRLATFDRGLAQALPDLTELIP